MAVLFMYSKYTRHKLIFDLESGHAFIILAKAVGALGTLRTSILQSRHLPVRNCVLPRAAPEFVVWNPRRFNWEERVSQGRRGNHPPQYSFMPFMSNLKNNLTSFQGDSPLSRSRINRAVATAKIVLEKLSFPLPPFADWSPDQWRQAGEETAEIRDCMLGWDVTDFGSQSFETFGRTLFTLRNGRTDRHDYPKPYAEKVLIEPEGQRSPLHCHLSKREDIINRGGGQVVVLLYRSADDGTPDTRAPLDIQVDGFRRRISAGEAVFLRAGESLSIPPRTFHQFWGEGGVEIDGRRYSISIEVSSVCDDWNDNVFFDQWAARFPKIVEDEERTCFLCHEYPDARMPE